MDTYSSFAQVYDEVMDMIPYEEWHVYLKELLEEYHIKKGNVVLELGCGTGNMTRKLAKDGYKMIGLDLSEEMLSIAKEKDDLCSGDNVCNIKNEEDTKLDIDDKLTFNNQKGSLMYIQQDMTKFTLNGTVDAIISICDSMNYLVEPEQFLATLSQIKEYLDEEGVFIFDLKTEYFYKEVCGDNIFAEDKEEVSYIWDNCYDEEIKINEYALSLFVLVNQEQGLYKKYTEFHYQRAYSLTEVKQYIKLAGLKLVHIYDAFTHKKPNKKSERVYVIVKK